VHGKHREGHRKHFGVFGKKLLLVVGLARVLLPVQHIPHGVMGGTVLYFRKRKATGNAGYALGYVLEYTHLLY
jgi:hypothetical protein